VCLEHVDVGEGGVFDTRGGVAVVEQLADVVTAVA
jgi:hypothetical protein